MTTTFRFEQGPMVSAAHLTSDDGGKGFVFCAIPGGTPQFQVSRDSRYASPVVNAPAIDSHRAFVAFVRERFGDDA
jgi:hypothetical protein